MRFSVVGAGMALVFHSPSFAYLKIKAALGNFIVFLAFNVMTKCWNWPKGISSHYPLTESRKILRESRLRNLSRCLSNRPIWSKASNPFWNSYGTMAKQVLFPVPDFRAILLAKPDAVSYFVRYGFNIRSIKDSKDARTEEYRYFTVSTNIPRGVKSDFIQRQTARSSSKTKAGGI